MPKFTPNKAGGGAKRFSLVPEIAIFDLLRCWWVVVIGVLISAMVSYVVVTETYEPDYTSTATFVVTTKGTVSTNVFTNLNTARGLAESFKYVLDSDALMETVCAKLGIDSFPGTVSSTLLEDTNILSLTVTSNSPSLTFRMINAIIDNHHIISDSVISNAAMDLLMRPAVPKAPAHPMQRASAMKKSMLLTAIGLIAVIVLFSAMNDKVKNDEDVRNRIDCDRLSTLGHEKSKFTLRSLLRRKVKRNILINDPTTSFGYSETFRLLRTRVEYLMEKGRHKVLMVGSVLDNEGKSTIAVNLALMLTYNNKRVLLIEGDMMEPAIEKMLGISIDSKMSIGEYLFDPMPIDRLPHADGAPLMSLLICKLPIPNSTEVIGSSNMAEFMDAARKHFDYIIIDTPPIAYSSDAESLAELCDAALMVIKQNTATAARINDAIETLERSGIKVIGCVFNDVRRIALLDSAANAVHGGYNASYDVGRRRSSRKRYGYGYGYGNDASAGGDRSSSFRAAETVDEEVKE